jgi:branched-chain amino acid transport system substrate-binding protein
MSIGTKVVSCVAAWLSLLVVGTFPSFAQLGPGVTDKEVKIGMWQPLTGPVAIYGIPFRNGAQAYVDMINAQGGINGRKIDLIVEDNAYNPQRTVAAARKLIGSDQVLAIVSANGTSQSAAAFPYMLDEEKTPFLMPFASSLDWYYPPRANLYGDQVPYEFQGEALGRLALKNGAKRILVMVATFPAFAVIGEHAISAIHAADPSAWTELYSVKVGTHDFAPIALDVINNKKPDAIIIIILQDEMVLFAKEMKRQGHPVPLYTHSPNVGQSLIDLGGDAVEGLTATSVTVPWTRDTPEVREYKDAMAKYFPGQPFDGSSLATFGQMKIFGDALRRVKEPLNRKSLIDALETFKNYDDGIFGPLTFSPTQHMGESTIYPVKIQNGKWTPATDPIVVAQPQ